MKTSQYTAVGKKHLKVKNVFFFQLKTQIGSYPRPEVILFQDNFDRTKNIFLPEKQVMYGSIFLHHVGERNMLPQMYEVYRLVMDQATEIWVLSFGSKHGLCKVFCYIFGIIFEDFLRWSTLKVLQKYEKSSTMLYIWQKNRRKLVF